MKVVRNYEIQYCDYCSVYVTNPEIEESCPRKPDLLREVLRREELEREYVMWKRGKKEPV